jgi:hypothetical protein
MFTFFVGVERPGGGGLLPASALSSKACSCGLAPPKLVGGEADDGPETVLNTEPAPITEAGGFFSGPLKILHTAIGRQPCRP